MKKTRFAAVVLAFTLAVASSATATVSRVAICPPLPHPHGPALAICPPLPKHLG